MRRKLIPALVIVAAALAGCGSSSPATHASNPVASELSYFPTDTPFILTIATDPNAGSVQSGEGLLSRFPEASLGIAALESKLSSIGLDYDADIKPLFGNPIAFGFANTGGLNTSSVRTSWLLSWVTKSSSDLKTLVSKLTRGSSSSGTRDGATLYQAGAYTVALDGATLVFGPSAVVSSALDRHAHTSGFTSAEFSNDTAGLPQNTLIEALGSLTGVLSQPSAAKVRQVPWVAAIRSYGAAVSVSASGLTFQYRLDTSGGSLTSQQVPIAAGTTPPSLAGSLPIAVGIDDPSQIVSFAEAADQAASPGSYAKFEARQAAAKRKLGINLNSITSLLTGDLIVGSDTHTTMVRATVSNPTAAAGILAKLARLPQAVFKRGGHATSLGGGFYSVNTGRTAILVGLVGNQLVGGKATVAELRSFAAAPTSPASFGHGSVAFSIALPQLLQLVMKQQPSVIESAILSHLGNITGWAAASASALTGSATLAIK